MENRYFVLENIPIDECIWNKGGNTMKELIKNKTLLNQMKKNNKKDIKKF